MNSSKFIFLIVLFLFCNLGEAQSRIKVDSQNVSLFQVLTKTNPPIACYSGDFTLGTLSTKKLKIGSVWTQKQLTEVQANLLKFQQKLKKAKKNKNDLAATRLKIKVKTQKQLVKSLNNSVSKCINLIPDGEFAGSASSLAPYRENLTPNEIKHILKKVAFGGDEKLVQIAQEQGLSALVDALVDGDDQEVELMSKAMEFGSQGLHYQDENPNYPIYTPYVLRPAQIYRFIYSPKPFKEWMLLNLSGHFSVNLNRIGFAYSSYSHLGMKEHWDLLINNSMGSFKDLTLAMLDDKAMNFWLDNKDNQIGAPNQNFARELLELFILGKVDPVTGIPNYEEESVIASTGFLSGYYEDADYDAPYDQYRLKISFEEELHDSNSYQLFTGFSEAEVLQTFHPAGFINHVFNNHPGASRFIAERFAGMMLYSGLPENVVAELASLLKSSDYQLKPFYKKILKSQSFFSKASVDSCFSSPIEQIITLARKIFPENLVSSGDFGKRAFHALINIADTAGAAGQSLFEPPSVFGWKGACNINRNGSNASGEGWIKTQRLLNRATACGEMMGYLNWYELDYLAAIDLAEDASPEEIVEHLEKRFSAKPLLFQEKELLITYLRTFKGDDYDYVADPDLSENWVVRAKIPRAICLIYDLGFNNFR